MLEEKLLFIYGLIKIKFIIEIQALELKKMNCQEFLMQILVKEDLA